MFFATPHGVAMAQARELVGAGIKIIDLAADFRLKDPAVFEKWYGMPHTCPDLLAESVYGLPEVNREAIRAARIVGNPGCYPTAVQLGFLPLIEAGIVDAAHLVADCKSGVSGAGRKAEMGLLFAEASDNFRAYSVKGHRHHPEIVQGLNAAARSPVLDDLHAASHADDPRHPRHAVRAAHRHRASTCRRCTKSAIAGEPFVDVMPAGPMPDTRSVRASNVCRIAVHRPQGGDMALILAVEDNLVKGAAGQAIQNMNLMFGLPETTGLTALPVLP